MAGCRRVLGGTYTWRPHDSPPDVADRATADQEPHFAVSDARGHPLTTSREDRDRCSAATAVAIVPGRPVLGD